MSAESPRKAYKYTCNMVRPQSYSEKSLMESVVDFFSDVVPQAYSGSSKIDDKEKIQWVRFEDCDSNDIAKNPDLYKSDTKGLPLLLILGYSNGVQIWYITPNGEAQEIMSVRQGPVRLFRVLPSPDTVLGYSDTYTMKRPLAVMCDSSSAGQPYCSVKFVSLKTGDEVHSINYKTLTVQNVECNKRFLVTVFYEKVCVYEACQFKQLFWITSCYPCPGPKINPIALSTRWLAYADKRLVPMHQSCGGMSGDGSQSYAATVISAAKGCFKGLSLFGEAMVSSVTGNKPGYTTKKVDTGVVDNGDRPGIVSVVDLQNIHTEHFNVNEDNDGDGLIAHFHAHANEPVANMAFDSSGTLLVTSCKLGHNFHIFRLMAHPCNSSLGAVHHLYTLHRGDTTAKVIDIGFNHDTRWVTVSTHRGTTHLFPITPYGGSVNVRTHCQPHVVNRASRFHKSAGLDEIEHNPVGRRSPVLSSSPGSSGQYDRYPTLIQQNTLNNNMGNPRLPPYPHPITVYPAYQIKQPLNVSMNPGNKNNSPTHSPTGVDNIFSVSAKFSTPRMCVIGSPKLGVERRESSKRPVDSLFILAQSGTLVEYILEPRGRVSSEKVTDEAQLDLGVLGRMQWNLQRLKNSPEQRPPLPSNSPLILAREAVVSQVPTAPDLFDLPGLTRQESKESLSSDHSGKDDTDEQWLSQVEIITHAGPHRRLWMGPQFSFKTYQNTTVLSSNSSSLLSQSPEGSMAAMDIAGDEGDLESLKIQPARSNPVSMPTARPAYRRLSGSDSSPTPSKGGQSAPLMIEAGSYDQSPHLCDVYSNWTESTVAKQPHLSDDLEEDRLKETLADAMVESPVKDAGKGMVKQDVEIAKSEDTVEEIQGSAEMTGEKTDKKKEKKKQKGKNKKDSSSNTDVRKKERELELTEAKEDKVLKNEKIKTAQESMTAANVPESKLLKNEQIKSMPESMTATNMQVDDINIEKSVPKISKKKNKAGKKSPTENIETQKSKVNPKSDGNTHDKLDQKLLAKSYSLNSDSINEPEAKTISDPMTEEVKSVIKPVKEGVADAEQIKVSIPSYHKSDPIHVETKVKAWKINDNTKPTFASLMSGKGAICSADNDKNNKDSDVKPKLETANLNKSDKIKCAQESNKKSDKLFSQVNTKENVHDEKEVVKEQPKSLFECKSKTKKENKNSDTSRFQADVVSEKNMLKQTTSEMEKSEITSEIKQTDKNKSTIHDLTTSSKTSICQSESATNNEKILDNLSATSVDIDSVYKKNETYLDKTQMEAEECMAMKQDDVGVSVSLEALSSKKYVTKAISEMEESLMEMSVADIASKTSSDELIAQGKQEVPGKQEDGFQVAGGKSKKKKRKNKKNDNDLFGGSNDNISISSGSSAGFVMNRQAEQLLDNVFSMADLFGGSNDNISISSGSSAGFVMNRQAEQLLDNVFSMADLFGGSNDNISISSGSSAGFVMNRQAEQLLDNVFSMAGSISLIILEEHGIHSRMISEMAPPICYHSNYGNTDCSYCPYINPMLHSKDTLVERSHTIKLDTGATDPLVDDVIRTHVSGLVPRAKITIHVTVKEGKYTFGSSGCYYADDDGNVDVGEIPSVLGTYTGLHQMGLFWSVIPAPGQPPGLRLLKTNASEPLVTKVTVHHGHVDFEDLFLLDNKPNASVVLNRWYMDKSVRKVIVRHDRLKGALFIPPGKGPFPGVIDMFGTIGSLVESRAALLASRGFATFALAWFHYDGLPKHLEEVDLDYFMEAIEWLVSQSCVTDNGIGVIGVSKGGEIALQMAYYSPKVKAVVSINGLPFMTAIPLYYRGGFIGISQLDQNAVKITPEGKVSEDAILCDPKYFLPLHQTDTNVLLISGTDDRCLNYKLLDAFYHTYPLGRRHLCELMIYEGAGHLIEPPYAPLTRVARARLSGVSKNKGPEMVLWGGRTLQHAKAQEHSWSKILNFFRMNVSRPSYSSHL